MGHFRLWLLTTGVLLAPTTPVLAAQAAQSQAAPPTQPPASGSGEATAAASNAVSEVVVTAQKRTENIEDVPISISAQSGKQLIAKGVNNVLQLQNIVPSLRIDTITQAAGVSIQIRGIGTFSNAAIDPDVAPYIDGVYIPRPGAILTSFLDVDDVEVLRGPQGTLFGRNATVGAISLHTVAPSFQGNSGELTTEVGNYGELKAQGIANLAINDNLAVRIAAYDSHTDGDEHDETDGKTYGRSDTAAARVSVKAKITPALTWTGRLDYAQTTGDGLNVADVDSATASTGQLAAYSAKTGIPLGSFGGPSYNFVGLEDNPSLRDTQVGVSSDLSWDVGSGYSFRLIDSFRSWSDYQHDGDETGTTLNLFNRTDTFSSNSQSHELQLISPKDKLLGGRLDFVAGLYYFEETYSTTEVFNLGSQFCNFIYASNASAAAGCGAAPQNDATDGIFHQLEESVAGYVQANFKITDSLELDVGGRYTEDTKSGSFLQTANNTYAGAGVLRAPENTNNLSFSDSHPNYRVNLNWHLSSNIMTYISYSTGYKSGGFNNNGGVVALTSATRTFASETSTNLEVGVKSTFLDRRVLLNADLFQMNLYDFQDRSFNGLEFIVRNAGNVRARGLEAEGEVRPTGHIKLDYGLDYLDSIYTQDDTAPGLPGCTGAVGSCSTTQNLSGHPTDFAPRWTTDLGLEYDTSAFEGGWTAQLRGTMNYSSHEYTTDDDNPQSITGGNTIFGARLTAVSPDETWTVSIFGANLTDVNYFTVKFVQPLAGPFGVNVAATGASLMRGYLGAPRTFGARITKRF